MFKNWKSTLAFLIFVGIYIYSVVDKSSDDIVETAGYVALISSLFMMFRSQITSDMIKILIDNVSNKNESK